MRLLHRNEIDFLGLDERTIRLSKAYYEKGAVQLLNIQEVETVYGYEYRIYAIVEISKHMNECRLILDEYMNIQGYDCDCPWGTYGICAHVGVVIYMISLMTFDSFPYHFQKTTKSLQEFLLVRQEHEKKLEREYHQRMIRAKLESSQKIIDRFHINYQNRINSMLKYEKYSLYPSFEFDSEYLLIGFQIGADKKYVLKNFDDFIERIDNHEYHSYGKYLAMVHDIENFDKMSKKWIHFIRQEIMRDRYSDYDYRYNYYDGNRYIKVNEDNISQFFHMFKSNKIKSLRFETGEFKYRLTIKENEDYYSIHQNDDLNLISSHDGFYKISQNTITHYPVMSASELKELIETLTSEPLYVDKKSYNDFEHYVLSPYKEYLEIDDQRNESVTKEVLVPTLYKVYGDLFDESTVVFHAVANMEGTEVEIIGNNELAPSFQTDLIKVMLEEAADYIDDEHKAYFNLDHAETYELIREGTQQLAKFCDVFVSEELKRLGQKTKYNLAIGVTLKNDLLEVNLESQDFDVNEVDEILRAYRKKKRYYRLKNGLMIHLESDELDELDTLMDDYNIKLKDLHEGKVQMENYRALSLDKRLDDLEYIKINQNASLKKYIKDFENMSSDVKVDPQYVDVLRPYQKLGTEWLLTLYRYNLNGILADEMGLGKTLQVIAMLDSIRNMEKVSLVVCPASLIYNWEDEISRFSKTLKCISITGSKEQREISIHQYRQYDLLITSYDYLRRDVEQYEDCEFEYVILDEAQYIKNQKTKNAQSVKSLNAKHRLALSGTPIENALAELWSIFDFLMPGYLYTYHYFKQEYEVAIALNENQDVSKKLKELVTPFILRRTKKEVLKELPDKVDHKYLLEFTSAEKKLYLANLATVNTEMQAKMKNSGLDHIAILSMLTKLRQLCCDPRLVYDNVKQVSTKVQATVDLIKVMCENGKKILLFSAFTSLLDLVSEELTKENITFYMLTGSTNKDERRQLVHDFNEDRTNVFLISLKAGGTGLNLTSAEVVIHIDPWWNISAQNQATDRAHRIGQNANVQVYRMIMKDSIEEKILKMQERKANLANSFVEGNDGSLSKMSKNEIMDLFER